MERHGEIRDSYKRFARALLEHGNYPAIATHDESLIQDTIDFTREKRRSTPRASSSRCCTACAAGAGTSWCAPGTTCAIYVPYGTHWMPYFYRRLRERKENVLFVLKGLFGG